MPFMRRAIERLVFIDETSTSTKLTKLTGWSPVGERFYGHAPFGHWQTQTFIAALRWHGLEAPWIVNAPMNRQIFETYVESQLAPTLSKRDVVILDNLSSHKSPRADEIIRQTGAWTLFLPGYSPDLNPIEMAFAKIKALLRKAAARTYDQIWKSLGEICELFSPEECMNYFKAAGYEGDLT